jgi:hypothetical protein
MGNPVKLAVFVSLDPLRHVPLLSVRLAKLALIICGRSNNWDYGV